MQIGDKKIDFIYYSWIGLEGQFLTTDCPYKPTFSEKKLALAENSKFIFSKVGL